MASADAISPLPAADLPAPARAYRKIGIALFARASASAARWRAISSGLYRGGGAMDIVR